MYKAVVPLADLYTVDDIARSAEVISRYAISKHHVIDLETESLPEKYPELAANPSDIVIFSEVLEHVRVSPQEIIGDLLKVLAPDGVFLVTTPNGLSLGHARALFAGTKRDAIYARSGRNVPALRHIHVREYTAREIRDAAAAAGGRVLFEGIRTYYAPPTDPMRKQYVSARDALLFLIQKQPI